jgi:site-specific DNA-methyltransferase (adenine-specific)
VAANVERYGTGALNIDASRVQYASEADMDAARVPQPKIRPEGHNSGHALGTSAGRNGEVFNPSKGRWPPNLLLSHNEDCVEGACADGCAVAEMDRQSGTLKSGRLGVGHAAGNRFGVGNLNKKAYAITKEYGNDSGGASRFFPVFRYQAKPSRSERETGLREAGLREAVVRTGMGGEMPTDDQGKQRDRFSKVAANTHPTVKSIGLMDWLIRLVTPPGGVVLDPFMGSGTTGVAAVKGGFGFIGIEREDEYLAIARARIEAAE